jgi:endoglycosylceramidase
MATAHLRRSAVLVAPLLACFCGKPPGSYATISGSTLRDPENGQIFLRGFNLSGRDKFPPFFPVSDLPDGGTTEWSVDTLSPTLAAGMNAIRFVIVWEAVEPSRDSFDSAYLDHVQEWVQNLEAAGYWVVIDMHQDLYSRAFTDTNPDQIDSSSDGAPAWTCDASNYAAFAKIYDPTKPWFEWYTSQPVTACFDHLWQNGDGVADEFANAWAQVAARFAKEPRVLGYDLFNEPWPGSSPYNDGTFGTTLLQPFYEKAIAAIQAVDPNHFFFLEPAAVTVDFQVPTGFRPMPGFKVVFYPHYYDQGESLGGTYGGNQETITGFAYLVQAAQRFGDVPWALGEMGGYTGDPLFPQASHDIYAQVDANASGAFWWDVTTLVDGSGGKFCSAQSVCPLDVISRPHPLRIAGTQKSFTWDDVNAVATLVFDDNPGTTGTTDISLPGSTWTAGPKVTTTDPSGWRGTWVSATATYHYQANGSGQHTLTLTEPGP